MPDPAANSATSASLLVRLQQTPRTVTQVLPKPAEVPRLLELVARALSQSWEPIVDRPPGFTSQSPPACREH